MQIHMISNPTCLRWQQGRFHLAKFFQRGCFCRRPKQPVDQLNIKYRRDLLFNLFCDIVFTFLSVLIRSDTYVSFKIFWEISHPSSCSCFNSLCILLHQLPHPFSLISSHLITSLLTLTTVLYCAIIVNLRFAVVHQMRRTWFHQVERWRVWQTEARLAAPGTSLSSCSANW